MYVYCDLLVHVVVRDTKAPLLRIVKKPVRMYEIVQKIFNPASYVPLQKKNFDTVEINIMDDTGKPIYLFDLENEVAGSPGIPPHNSPIFCLIKRCVHYYHHHLLCQRFTSHEAKNILLHTCTKTITPGELGGKYPFSLVADINEDTDWAVFWVVSFDGS